MRWSKPTRIVQMGLNRLSTTALVARVVETETRDICSRRTPGQVPMSRQRLGARENATIAVERYRIGVGAAGVQADPDVAVVGHRARIVRRNARGGRHSWSLSATMLATFAGCSIINSRNVACGIQAQRRLLNHSLTRVRGMNQPTLAAIFCASPTNPRMRD
jgi:hypothetical protein